MKPLFPCRIVSHIWKQLSVVTQHLNEMKFNLMFISVNEPGPCRGFQNTSMFLFSHLLAQFGPDQENTSRESVLACVSKSL